MPLSRSSIRWRAFNRVGNELIRILAELALVFPGEELGIACHHAERLLKVMRGGVGEVLEIIVQLSHPLFGPLLLSDIAGNF